jgi:hypothetical protein
MFLKFSICISVLFSLFFSNFHYFFILTKYSLNLIIIWRKGRKLYCLYYCIKVLKKIQRFIVWVFDTRNFIRRKRWDPKLKIPIILHLDCLNKRYFWLLFIFYLLNLNFNSWRFCIKLLWVCYGFRLKHLNHTECFIDLGKLNLLKISLPWSKSVKLTVFVATVSFMDLDRR